MHFENLKLSLSITIISYFWFTVYSCKRKTRATTFFSNLFSSVLSVVTWNFTVPPSDPSRAWDVDHFVHFCSSQEWLLPGTVISATIATKLQPVNPPHANSVSIGASVLPCPLAWWFPPMQQASYKLAHWTSTAAYLRYHKIQHVLQNLSWKLSKVLC